MEIEEQQQPAGNESSLEDTLGSAFDKATEVHEDAEQPEIAVKPDKAAEKPDRARDESGKFAKKEADEPEGVVDEDIEIIATDEQPEVEAADEQDDDNFPYKDAPATWKKEAAAEYAELSPTLKAEIHRREEDFHNGLGQYKEMANIGRVLDKEIQPYAELIRSNNTTAPAVVRELLGTQHALTTGTAEQKAAVVAKILRDYRIDTDAVNAALEKPAPDPQYTQLSNQVNQLQTQLSEAQLAPYMEQVSQFAADPKNEYYTVVEQDMQALISQGRATSLKDAYDKAIWANPDVRAKLMAKQSEAERKRKADKAAEAKRAGSVNVSKKGAPPTSPTIGTGKMVDTLSAAYDRATSS